MTARDPFGGEGATTFLVAAPAAAPGAPTFPATAYIYGRRTSAARPVPHVERTQAAVVGYAGAGEPHHE